MHLDLASDDLAADLALALKLGATKASLQPMEPEGVVLLDPEGHPFCLFTETE